MAIFFRYSEQARRAIYFARLEANHRNEKQIGVRDLLLGLTWDSDTRVARIASLKARAAEFRGAMRIPYLPSTALEYKRRRDVPLEDDVKRVLAYTTLEAEWDRQFWIDTDHLLRGILRFRNDVGDVLLEKGLTLEFLRSESQNDRREHPPAPVPLWPGFRETALRYKALLAPLMILLAAVVLVLLLKFMGPVPQ